MFLLGGHSVCRRYHNLDHVDHNKTMVDMLRWMRERRKKVKDLSNPIPHAEEKMKEHIHLNKTKTSYTWIGHSTFLLQINGLNILTDPVFGRRMGFQKRLTAPGLEIHELPRIDIVVISHGHYDHLEFPSLKMLKGDPTFYVPAGLKPLFQKQGLYKVIEANWWDRLQYDSLSISFVPAQHWTRRNLFDMNTSHWGGWVFETGEQTFYFVGDTGYFRGFQEIGRRFDINTVFMPIGAYEPEWFMNISHINPEDSIKAYMDLGAKTFVPMHYGAYRLADDTGPEALQRLYNEWERLNLPKDKLRVLKIGETCWT